MKYKTQCEYSFRDLWIIYSDTFESMSDVGELIARYCASHDKDASRIRKIEELPELIKYINSQIYRRK